MGDTSEFPFNATAVLAGDDESLATAQDEFMTDEARRRAHVQSLLDRLLQRSPIYNILMTGSRLLTVTRGRVTTSITLTPTHLNGRGGLHGAVSATMIDFVTGLALASWDLRETTGASVDMHISYLSGRAGVGDLVELEATAERVGGRVSFVTVRIWKVEERGRTLVTLGQHTKYMS